MNVHNTYALTSPVDTNRFLRKWTSLSRVAICGAIFLSDVAIIVSMAWLTGIGYHFAAYRELGDILSYFEVGVLSAIIFTAINGFRGEYRLSSFFAFKPHMRHSIKLWNVTFICLLAIGFIAKVSVIYSRAWIAIYYALTICIL